MLRDNETFSSNAVIQIFGDVLGHGVMLGMDEPVHGRLRSLVTKAFTQKALARWEDEIVGRIGNELIDEFAAGRQDRPGQDVHLSVSDPHHRRAARPAGTGLPAVPALVDLDAVLHRQPGTRRRGVAGAGRLLQADPAGAQGRAARGPDQQPRGGRDRRAQARRRGHLLLHPAAAARRGGDDVPVAGEPAVRPVDEPGPTRRDSGGPHADTAGDRGSGALGCTAAEHHQGGDPRHRTRRGRDPAGVLGDADARRGQPAGGPVSRPGPLRHLPAGEGSHQLGTRGARVSRHAPGAARDAHRDQPAAGPAAQPAAGSGRRRPAHPGMVFRSPTSLPVLFDPPTRSAS